MVEEFHLFILVKISNLGSLFWFIKFQLIIVFFLFTSFLHITLLLFAEENGEFFFLFYVLLTQNSIETANFLCLLYGIWFLLMLTTLFSYQFN